MTDKEKIKAEIERLKIQNETYVDKEYTESEKWSRHGAYHVLFKLLSFINSLPEELVNDDLSDMSKIDSRIQYANIESGIHAHAETYSFNIESQLFNQLTKEQQGLWRKEIEQAVISGGHCGVELARDKRYEENQKQVSDDLEKAIYLS